MSVLEIKRNTIIQKWNVKKHESQKEIQAAIVV